MSRYCLVLTFGSSVGLAAGACSSSDASSDDGSTSDDGGQECPVGTEGCPCTSGGACDPGLECLSGICVNPEDTPGDDGEEGTGSDGADDGGGDGGGSGGDDGGTGDGGGTADEGGTTGDDDGGATGDDGGTDNGSDDGDAGGTGGTGTGGTHTITDGSASNGTVTSAGTPSGGSDTGGTRTTSEGASTGPTGDGGTTSGEGASSESEPEPACTWTWEALPDHIHEPQTAGPAMVWVPEWTSVYFAGGVPNDSSNGMRMDRTFDVETGTWVPVRHRDSSSQWIGCTSWQSTGVIWTGEYVIKCTGDLSCRYIGSDWSDCGGSVETPDLDTGDSGRAMLWTGVQMILWGGHGSSSHKGAVFTPVDPEPGWPMTGTWEPTANSDTDPNAPLGRADPGVVWTGDRMVIWGGGGAGWETDTGAVYDPATDSWQPVSDVGSPSARHYIRNAVVWLEPPFGRVFVWGGADAFPLDNGALYDPEQDLWEPLSDSGAPSARLQHTAVWTGEEVIVWGGQDLDKWLNDGGHYDPATDTWTPTQDLGAPTPRAQHRAVWTGEEMILWGGEDGDHRLGVRDGARYRCVPN